MPDSSRDTRQTKPDSDKKQPETVQLSAEELKAIAGGAAVTPATPDNIDSTNDVVKSRGGKRPHP